jgi:hypothetical protein
MKHRENYPVVWGGEVSGDCAGWGIVGPAVRFDGESIRVFAYRGRIVHDEVYGLMPDYPRWAECMAVYNDNV